MNKKFSWTMSSDFDSVITRKPLIDNGAFVCSLARFLKFRVVVPSFWVCGPIRIDDVSKSLSWIKKFVETHFWLKIILSSDAWAILTAMGGLRQGCQTQAWPPRPGLGHRIETFDQDFKNGQKKWPFW